MHLIAVGIACIVLFVGAFVGKKELAEFSQKHPETQVQSTEEVLSTQDEDQIPETETPTPTETVTPTPSVTLTPTPISSPSQSSTMNTKTSVKVYARDGNKYAEVNGVEVQLDAKGCYSYEKDGTKIHACVYN